MNSHDYHTHMINEDSLRAASANNNHHQEFFQSYLSSGTDADTVATGRSSGVVVPHRRESLSDGARTVDGENKVVKLRSPLQGNYSGYGPDGTFTMKYRNIGKNGIRVPLLAFSAWNSFGEITEDAAEQVLTAAYENGVNYFDTGDAFCQGQAEIMLGNVLQRKGWRRSSYIVSTKLFWKNGPTTHLGGGLSRKFLVEAVEASLRRLQLKYIDILIINKLDAMCPMEEIVRTVSYLINNGIIFYWGTSRFSPMHISEAFSIARQFNCPPPICEQMEYHMFVRDKMELQMLELFHKSGIGCITWSPISMQSDLGISLITRRSSIWENKPYQVVRQAELIKLCNKLGCDLTQLSLAWCLQNENVNCILITATTVNELYQKLNAVKLYTMLSPPVNEEIERILANNPVLKRQLQKGPSITIEVADGDEIELGVNL